MVMNYDSDDDSDSDLGLPSINDADDLFAEMDLQGRFGETVIHSQIKELGATFERGINVMRQFQQILHENPNFNESSRSVDLLLFREPIIRKLRDENQVLKANEAELQKQNYQLNQKVMELKGSVQDLEEENRVLRANESKLKQQNDQLDEAATELKNRVQNLEEKLDAQPLPDQQRSSHSQRNINEFQAKEFENQTREIAQLTADLEMIQISAAESKKRCDDLEAEVTRLHRETEKLEEQRQTDQSARQNLEQEVTQIKTERDQFSHQVQSLQNQLATIQQNVTFLTTESERYKTKLQQRKTNHNEQIAQLRRQVQDLQFALDSAKLSHQMNLKDAYLKVCKEMKIKKPENVDTLDEVREWTQQQLRNLVKERAVNGNKVEELQKKVDELNKQLMDEQNERAIAVKNLQDHLNPKSAEKEKIMQHPETGGTSMESKVQSLESEMNDLRRTLRQAEDCNRLLKIRIKRHEKEVADLLGQIAELEKKLQVCCERCTELDHTVKLKDVEIARMKNVMKVLRLRSDVRRFSCESCGEEFGDMVTLQQHVDHCQMEQWS